MTVALMATDVHAERRRDCGDPTVNIVYDGAAELATACGALMDIGNYFRHIGFAISPTISLRFVDRPAEGDPKHEPVHGYFDAPRSQIIVYRKSDASPWGLPWSSQMAGSFLHHELAHMAIWEVLSDNSTRLRPEWHEFIAYAIQFDLMPPELRKEVLRAHADVQPFAGLLAINEFTSRMNPERFAIASYKTYLLKGGDRFVAQLLRGGIIPPRFSYPFPFLPGQAPSQ